MNKILYYHTKFWKKNAWLRRYPESSSILMEIPANLLEFQEELRWNLTSRSFESTRRPRIDQELPCQGLSLERPTRLDQESRQLMNLRKSRKRSQICFAEQVRWVRQLVKSRGKVTKTYCCSSSRRNATKCSMSFTTTMDDNRMPST